MLADSQYFILSIDSKDYREIRANRRYFLSVSENHISSEKPKFIVYLTNNNNFVAQFDTVKVERKNNKIVLDLEPIYISHPTLGIRVSDLLLLQLLTYNSVSNWREKLSEKIININNRDFLFLSNKLIG